MVLNAKQHAKEAEIVVDDNEPQLDGDLDVLLGGSNGADEAPAASDGDIFDTDSFFEDEDQPQA